MEKYYKPKGCPVHGTVHLNDNDVTIPKLGIDQNKFNDIAKKITDDTLISEELFTYTNDFLQKGINQVWGNVKYDDSNFVFVQRLKRNASRFAGYKTASQTKAIQKAKPDEYSAINNSYNNNWLRSEYVHTVRSNRSAQNWRKYQADKDIYPFLEYMPSSSAEPRTEHQRLVGVIKSIDDSFWNTWLPPSDWGCKCSVQQRRKDTGSNPVPDNILLPPKNMRNNPGRTAQIFTDEHPMIKAVSKSRAEQIDKWIVNEIAKPILIKEYKNGGQYYENALMSRDKSDYEDLSTISDLFAKQEGFKVEIMPDRIHSKDIFYKYIFDGAYENKLPDLKINGKFYEYKSYEGDWNNRKISKMLKKGAIQSDNIIIDLRNGLFTKNYIHKITMDMIKNKTKITEVWGLTEKEIIKVF